MSSGASDLPINWSVEEFLDRFQAALSLRSPTWISSEKRFQELADLGIQFSDVLVELPKLDAKHHAKGPEPDDVDFKTCAIHIFKYPLEPGVDVYVKIGVKIPPGKKGVHIAKIWSFKRWTTLGER